MKRLLILLIGLLWTSNLLGQVQNEVKKVLDTKDFFIFKKYTNKLSNRKKGISSHWESLRDLTTEFKEGVFIFEESAPDINSPIYTYKVSIIATKTKIVYYELSEMKNKKVGKNWESYYESVSKFKDEKQFNNLKNSFKSIFNSDLNEAELFVTDFVYGENCGFGGASPKGRQQIDKWVKYNNKIELLNWLKSTNTEKQVYAVDGLFQLKKTGTKFTKEELKMIKFVINKRGTIYVCSGCIHHQDEISVVSKEFKL
jgi:hypothetical protein